MKTLIYVSLLYTAAFVSCKKEQPATPVSANNAGYIYTIAGNGYGSPSGAYSGDGGPATSAELWHPAGVAIDDSGNIYITDTQNQRVRKVKFGTGIITTIAGNGRGGDSGDGGQATNAEIEFPTGIAVDDSGNVYFADQYNNRIRKISRNGIITTYAGNGYRPYGFSGDGGPATSAELSSFVNQLALDSRGNLYIADNGNGRIRMVNTSGIITTFAGEGIGGYAGDGGPATNAELSAPEGVAVDKAGNVYITDYISNVVRKVNTSGIITTIAGNGTISGGYTGDGVPATSADLNEPTSVAVDSYGNVYICDLANARIRMVSTNGIITTVAGNGVGGYSGDGGAAIAAKISGVWGITVDKYDNIYIADLYNDRLRKVYKK